jgi:hypothetical protein
VSSEINTKQRNALCGQDIECLKVRNCGTTVTTNFGLREMVRGSTLDETYSSVSATTF